MKKILLIIASLLVGLTLVACGDKTESEATGYGIVHKQYIGVVDVKTVGDKIDSITFDEIFLPTRIGKITVADEAAFNETTMVKIVTTPTVGEPETTYYAKYVKVGDVVFQAEVKVVAEAQTINYFVGTVAQATYLADAEKAKAYALAANGKVAGDFFVDAEGAKLVLTSALIGDAANMNKSKFPGYWPESHAVGIGWEANIANLVKALKGKNLSTIKVEETIINADEPSQVSNWKIDGKLSGVSLTDFNDYYGLAKSTYEAAIKAKDVVPAK